MALAVESFWRRLRYTPLRSVLRGQLNGQLDWQRVVVEADLPIEIADMVSKVVLKARLWMGERFDVAQELVAHFQDGLEAGVSREELLASFGDAAGAAKLIRRSKRRGRPLVWQAWWWGSRSMVALFAGYVVMAILLAFDRPKISTDYLAIVNRPYTSVPEEDRAWPHYLRALEWLKANTEASPGRPHVSVADWLMGPKDGETYLLDGYHEYDKLEDAQRKAVDAWLDERAKFLILLRKATEYRHLGLASGDYSPRYRLLFGIQSPNESVSREKSWVYSVVLYHVQEMHSLSRILKADLRRSVLRNDGVTAFADLQAMIGIARHSGESPCLVSALVKCSLLNSAIGSFETALATRPAIWTDKQLVAIAHLLGAVRLEVGDYVQGEKAAFYDMVQRLYSDDGNGDGYLTAEGLRRIDREFRSTVDVVKPRFSEWQYMAATPASYFAFAAASRREMVAKFDEMWARMQAEADRPLWDPLPSEETAQSHFDRMSRIEKFRYELIRMSLPAYRASAVAFEKANGRREGALVGIALELYRREFGEWPGALERLSPRWLPEVPIDRVNGGPLGYRIVEGRPIVYSLGIDADDDGGVLPSDCGGDAWGCSLWPSAEVREGDDGDWVIWSTVEGDVE